MKTVAPLRKFGGLLALAIFCCGSHMEGATACVWKVTAPNGGTLYVGGSVHALRSSDYPLPAAYNRAFDASTNLAFEVDAKALKGSSERLAKAGRYPKGDSLKNHVDPRTYDYVRRLFALMNVPEAKFASMKPWLLVLGLQSLGMRDMSTDLGVDQYLLRRADATHKPVVGLETVQEHAAVYAGLSDRQGEALLLLTFIPRTPGTDEKHRTLQSWRNGDVDDLARMMKDSFNEFPSFGGRLLDERNRAWIPKIEKFARSGKTYFVVVGAGHLGGPNGVLAMLRSRGYRLEQL
jgi:uncharacterized protein